MDIKNLVSIFFLLGIAESQEVTTPSSLLGPRNFNHHAYEAKLKSLTSPVPTRKGPVLFPNNGSSAPDTPLIVTPRRLASLSKSQSNTNGSLNDNTNLQTFLAPITNYRPMVFGTLPSNSDSDATLSPSVATNVIDDYSYDSAPYTDLVKKSITGFDLENSYNAYGQSTSLPPIYDALSQHADRNLLNTQRKSPLYDYQSKINTQQHANKDSSNYDDNSENVEDKSYAFSYTVKDQKTGDDFSHSQRSSGSATNGEYRVLLPDGRTQIVSYTADENGYKADVRYDVASVTNNANDDSYKTNARYDLRYGITNSANDAYKSDVGYGVGVRNGANDNSYKTNVRYDLGSIRNSANDNVYKSDVGYDVGVTNSANDDSYKTNERYNVDTVGNSVEYSDSRLFDTYANQKPTSYNPSFNTVSQLYNPSQLKQDYNSKEYSNLPSKEYYDYSVEYEASRTPYSSKFASLYSAKTEFNGLDFSSTTTRPTYNDLEEVLTKALPNVRPTLYSYTGSGVSTGGATRNDLQNINPAFYDNYSDTVKGERGTTSNTLSDNPLNSYVASTPRSYLVSTIASLRDRVSAKPILSDSFINRINKYLTFK